jgi:hypothetical protein
MKQTDRVWIYCHNGLFFPSSRESSWVYGSLFRTVCNGAIFSSNLGLLIFLIRVTFKATPTFCLY